MHKVKSTYKVLAVKALQRDSAEDWIDWALEMLEAGFETEHLVILAGVSRHQNRFEFDHVVNRALRELSLDKFTNDEIIYSYVYCLIENAQTSQMPVRKVLSIIRDLCIEREYDKELVYFYYLAHAKEDLEDEGVQFYWKDADKDNIDAIIDKEFQDWKYKFQWLVQRC